MAIEYRYTDACKTTISFELTLDDVASMRDALTKAMSLDDVARYRVRAMIRTLAEAQAKAAELMAYEARTLADAAKLDDTF